MKRITWLFGIIGCACILLYFRISAFAQTGAYLSLQSSKSDYQQGDTIHITVLSNSGSESVNTVSVHLNYPRDTVRFLKSDFSQSSFPNIVEREEIQGILKYTAFVIGGKSGSARVVDLYFTALKEGNAKIEFISSSGMFSADGSGRDIESYSPPFTVVIGSQQNFTKDEPIAAVKSPPEEVFFSDTQSEVNLPSISPQQEIIDYTVSSKKSLLSLSSASELVARIADTLRPKPAAESSLFSFSIRAILVLLGVISIVLLVIFGIRRKRKRTPVILNEKPEE